MPQPFQLQILTVPSIFYILSLPTFLASSFSACSFPLPLLNCPHVLQAKFPCLSAAKSTSSVHSPAVTHSLSHTNSLQVPFRSMAAYQNVLYHKFLHNVLPSLWALTFPFFCKHWSSFITNYFSLKDLCSIFVTTFPPVCLISEVTSIGSFSSLITGPSISDLIQAAYISVLS